MNVIVCEHEYWRVGDIVKMIHNGDIGIIQLVERHDNLLVLEVEFDYETRKVSSNLVEKLETE